MSILKFCNFTNNSEDVISCSHYSVEKRNKISFITTYTTHLNVDGVERRIDGLQYDVCYVENDNGKTVAVYRKGELNAAAGGLTPAETYRKE